jgi:hypothetical protein
MSTISVYDINNYIKNHSRMTTLLGKTISIYPTIGYGDQTGPFIVYSFSPSIPNVEAYWMRKDYVLYTVFDTDLDKIFQISEILFDLLGKGDAINSTGGATGTDVILLSTVVEGTSLEPPVERDGWYKMRIEFCIYNVKK